MKDSINEVEHFEKKLSIKEDLISVIVPVYNVEKYLDKCLESIINQTYTNLEIILINDGSTDNSGKICEKYKQIDNRIIYISKENTGVSSTRNIGIDNSKGKYIVFIDSDDYLNVDMVEILYNNLKKFNTELSVCEYRNVDLNTKMLNNEESLISLFNSDGIQGYLWNKLYVSNIIKQNNIKFDSGIYICEDLLFNAEYLNYIDNCVFYTKQLYNYVFRSDSALNKKFNDKKLTSIDAYKKMESFYMDKSDLLYDIYKYNFTVKNISEKLKIKLNNYKNKDFEEKLNNNIKLYFKDSISSKNIKVKKKIKLFIYYYAFYVILFIKKFILKQK